jgi:hypothetical protein
MDDAGVIAGIGAELSVRTPPTQVSIETCKVVDTHGRPETGQNAAVTSLTLRHVARVAARHPAAVGACH